MISCNRAGGSRAVYFCDGYFLPPRSPALIQNDAGDAVRLSDAGLLSWKRITQAARISSLRVPLQLRR
jgi:hypothetical protein